MRDDSVPLDTAGPSSWPRVPFTRGRAWRLPTELRAALVPGLWLALGVLASFVYANAAKFLGPFTATDLPAPLFPQQGVILAVLLLTPPRRWGLYLLAYYGLQLAIGAWAALPPWYALLSNGANVLEPLAGALLLRRCMPLPPRFAGLREVALYVACVVGAAMLGAAWGAAARALAGFPFWASWPGWFLADSLASLVLAPTIVLWTRAGRAGLRAGSRRRALEAALLGAGLLLVGALVFGTRVETPDRAQGLLYLPVPLLLWAAVRFGPRGLMAALALVVGLAIAGVHNGLGPFVGHPTPANVFTLQLFLYGIGVPLFCLAALVQERQEAQAGLAQSEARYRAVARNFPHGAVLLFGPDLRHLLADGQGLPAAGLAKESVEGRTPWEAFPAALAAALAPPYRAALAGAPSALELAHAGRTYRVQVLPVSEAAGAAGGGAAPAAAAGAPPGAATGLAVLQDVTEQHRAADLAALDRAKTAFFGNVSHEFRTPLTLLLGPLQELLAAPPQRLVLEVRDQVAMAHRNGLRLLKLVNTLLDFARLEAGHLKAVFAPTDLAAYTAELASVFRSAVEHAGLRLAVDCPPLPEPVYVDRDHWETIVLNLLSNALKFTLTGAIMVALRPRGARAVLIVRDTGTGIPAAELPHLFERFHRVQGAQGRTQEGTGIGLALVQELARLHGGTVRVASAPGKGTAVTVALPRGTAHLPAAQLVAAADAPPAAGAGGTAGGAGGAGAAAYVEEAWRWLPGAEAPGAEAPGAEAPGAEAPGAEAPGAEAPGVPYVPAADAAAGAPAGPAPATPGDGGDDGESERPTRVLVADDNADMRAYLVRLLRGRGAVRAVGDGAAALEVARAWGPDLLLADLMMPGLDGFALLQAVRADAQLRPVSVILLSARADEQARLEGLRAGADDYLVKPFAAAALLARVDAQLGLTRLRGAAAAAAERRRLARELHNSVAQALFAAAAAAESLPRLWERDREEGRRALADLRRVTRGAHAEMRALLVELRPEALVRAPLHALLQDLAAAAGAKTGAAVAAQLAPVPVLPADIQVALYRIAQEALHNVVKHAAPTRITVRLQAAPGALTLEVTDDGRGFAPGPAPGAGGGLGLASMRERAAAIGATLRVASRPGGGTAVAVSWQAPAAAGPVPTPIGALPAAPAGQPGRAPDWGTHTHTTGT